MPQLAPLDGRLARSARTRHAVVDALLDLLGEGDLRPTAARIAERAGVSLRIVFHHFDDLEAIYSELADRQAERVKPLTVPIPVTLPFARRVEEFSAQRGRLLETLSPVRRAAVLMEPFRLALAKRLKHSRDLMRAAAIAAFAPGYRSSLPMRSVRRSPPSTWLHRGSRGSRFGGIRGFLKRKRAA